MTLSNVLTVGKDILIQQLARSVGNHIFAADTVSEALEFVDKHNPDLILFEYSFGTESIKQFRNAATNVNDKPIVIVGTAEQCTESYVSIEQKDICHYVGGKNLKQQLKQIVNEIEDKKRDCISSKERDYFFADELSASVSMVGHSKAALDTLKMIKIVAVSRCNPILISGETGTGKELVAKAASFLRHSKNVFIPINCAALTANLLESELFGHVKGSFTGADRDKTGLLELAGEGTVFLDEISEMPLDLQAKLLRVLQEKTFRKVGGTTEIRCNATIIASSNRSLKNEVKNNRFRQDLYYRLDICPINIAPLRSTERKEDIPLIAEYFLETSTICPDRKRKKTSITRLALEALKEHNWPGNVRELRNIIERAILLETSDKIGIDSIIIDSMENSPISENSRTDKVGDFSLVKAERELIGRALQETNWQKTKAAELLGISRATLYAKVKQHHLENSSFSATRGTNSVDGDTPIPSPLEYAGVD